MHYHKIKMTAAAMAMAVLVTGNMPAAELNTATVSAKSAISAVLPAAGVGLVLNDGVSVSQIREEIKKRKEEKEPAEPVASSDTKASVTQTVAESATEAEAAVEGEKTAWTGPPSDGYAIGGLAVGESAQEMYRIIEAVEPVLKEPETKISDEEREKEQDVLIIAQVNDYVNIRSTASTDGEIVGKLYNNSVGTLVAKDGDWYQVKSGSVEGYVKAEYFKTGDEAEKIADEVGQKMATVNTETLKVRSEASLEASVIGLVPGGEELSVLDEENGFVKVSIEEGDGWVSEDYVVVATEYVTAESIEEEKARIAEEEKAREDAKKAAQAAEERMKAKEKAKEGKNAEITDKSTSSESTASQQATVSSSGSGLGQSVANYAVKFVGNPYVYGGTSLTNGADCSGFVMSVYKNFGVSLPHSSTSDRYVGYNVGSLANAQPGDLVCYSGHVAIYIGNGQIVHASTEATGIKISNASYRTPVAIRRIF